MPGTSLEPLLRVPEVAEILGIRRSLAYELVRRGAIASVRVGRRARRCRVEDVRSYISAQLVGGGAA